MVSVSQRRIVCSSSEKEKNLVSTEGFKVLHEIIKFSRILLSLLIIKSERTKEPSLYYFTLLE